MLIRTLVVFSALFLHALVAEIPEALRKEYGSKMHTAFIQQSVGKATQAFYTFQKAYRGAQEAGESLKKLNAINGLFIWYRRYGSSVGLISGPSNISNEYRTSMHIRSPFSYNSEFGNDPEQAARIRDFLFGVGETISGILCVRIAPPPVNVTLGLPLLSDGIFRMWNSLNYAWAHYEMSLQEPPIVDFKKWEKTAVEAVSQ